MKYGSVCSGIEGASVAWEPLGWECAFVSEIEPFARAVLKHRFPDVPLHGDFTTIGADDYGAIDLLVGGTPCQSFSIAGLRGGLGDERGNLALEFLRLADRKRPRWLVWENVPGVLSSNGGRDFGSILGGMVQLGYGVAYRVLDAQYFGVPQRRRRVFVVGCFGDAARAAAVLFERASLSGHPTPRREAGAIASALTANGVGADGGPDDNAAQANHLVAHPPAIAFGAQVISPFLEEIALPVTGRHGDAGMVAFTCKDHGSDAGNVAPTLPAMHHDASHANAGGQIAVAFSTKESGRDATVELCPPLRAESGDPHMTGRAAVATSRAVRRLTPVECERLQGFQDGWTAVPYRGKLAADGPRYRALGNSMAVPCMQWIGERIQAATP